MRRLLILLILTAVPGVAEAQQPRAPAGGMYVNGHFYKGGQFIPQGGGYFGMPMDFSASWNDAMDVPAPRRKARTTARKTARTEYRTTARATEGAGIDQEGVASSRLQIAKKLIDAGKIEDARGWLEKVVEMKAGAEITDEARAMLAGLDRQSGAAEKVSSLGDQAKVTPRSARSNLGAVVQSATPRYFAQIGVDGPIRHGQLSASIGVLGSRDSTKTIGTAFQAGSCGDGQAAWGLIVRDSAVPGRFVIVDREFKEISK
jgi:hypothetical protein